MTAEVLREAARMMRERAEDATDGSGASDWFVSGGTRVRSSGGLVAETSPFEVEHVASWHPAVALAVADWLDRQANAYEANKALWDVSSQDAQNRWAERGLTVEANLEHHYADALAVARAYLT